MHTHVTFNPQELIEMHHHGNEVEMEGGRGEGGVGWRIPVTIQLILLVYVNLLEYESGRFN